MTETYYSRNREARLAYARQHHADRMAEVLAAQPLEPCAVDGCEEKFKQGLNRGRPRKYCLSHGPRNGLVPDHLLKRGRKGDNKAHAVAAAKAVLLEAQQGLCAICGNAETVIWPGTGEPKALAYDHDHETGEWRGLLCQACNTSLGGFLDDPKILQAAIDYLRRYGKS